MIISLDIKIDKYFIDLNMLQKVLFKYKSSVSKRKNIVLSEKQWKKKQKH